MKSIYYRFLYRPLMRFAHRFHWHYAPPIHPEGDTVLWCHWCGLRYAVPKMQELRLSPVQHSNGRGDGQ